jgi:hypothetical protein
VSGTRDLGGYDLFLEFDSNKVGLLLSEDEGGNKKWWPGVAPLLAQQINTGSFSYQQIPSEIEVPVPFEHWNLGSTFEGNHHKQEGIGTPSNLEFPAYFYSRGIDASYAGCLLLSPLGVNIPESDDTAIAGTPVRYIDSTLGFFVLAGQYIYEVDAGTKKWTERDNASSDGANYTDVVEMNGVLYAARGDSFDYKTSTDGVTWAAFTDSDNNFKYFTVRGQNTGGAVLWGIKGNGNIRNTTNGQNAGTAWSGSDTVGHTSETVNGMVTANDDIYVYKKEGIYRYTGSSAEDVWVGARQMLDSQNGVNPFVWQDGRVYAPYGNSLLQYAPVGDTLSGVELRFIFPAHPNEEVNGTITAIAGDSSWLYVAVKNAAGNTYILKGNPYKNGDHGEWHTFLYLGANDCNALSVAAPGSVVTSNPTLVVGYGTGAYYYILPRHHLRPDQDSNCTFDTGASNKLVGAWHDVGAEGFKKWLNNGQVIGNNLTAGRPIGLKYEIDGSGSEVSILSATSDGDTLAVVSGDVQFNKVRPVITLSTNDSGQTPCVEGVVLNTTPNPPRKRMWSFEVKIGDDLEMRGGGRSRLSGRDLEQFLFNALTKRCTLYDRRGRTFTVRVIDVRGVGASETDAADISGTQVRAAEVST